LTSTGTTTADAAENIEKEEEECMNTAPPYISAKEMM
jgi:hypothetical protein